MLSKAERKTKEEIEYLKSNKTFTLHFKPLSLI